MDKSTKVRSKKRSEPLDMRRLDFNHIGDLIRTDDFAEISYAELKSRRDTLMDRLLARAQAKGMR